MSVFLSVLGPMMMNPPRFQIKKIINKGKRMKLQVWFPEFINCAKVVFFINLYLNGNMFNLSV